MTSKVALLRGVNVGGNNKLPMKELAALLETIGCNNVRTYIQSGNVIFEGKATAGDISDAIQGEFEFRPPAVVLSANAFKKAAANCPFRKEADAAPKNVHLYFFGSPPAKNAAAELDAIKTASERFAVAKGVMYLHAPDGLLSSKIAEKGDRILKANATARNWNTVCKLIAMMEEAL